TRWNSTYYRIERLIEEKDPITACLQEKEFQKRLIKANVPTSIEWDLQVQLKSTLKPFETATRQLALASLPTISKILPVVTG
ncbi:unnamed protein product, partial [Didymodactylos carnosus]